MADEKEEYGTIEVRMDKVLADRIREIARIADVTPDQAASVLMGMWCLRHLRDEPKIEASIGKAPGSSPGCPRHPTGADEQCDACNGWPGTDAPVDQGMQHPVTKEWSGAGYEWVVDTESSCHGRVDWIKRKIYMDPPE